MRYSTPTHPVYRLAGYRSGAGPQGQYPGPYPVFQLVGYAPGVPVPNPAPVPPTPGHWRTRATVTVDDNGQPVVKGTPRTKPRTNPRPTSGVGLRSNRTRPQAKPDNHKSRSSNRAARAARARAAKRQEV